MAVTPPDALILLVAILLIPSVERFAILPFRFVADSVEMFAVELVVR